jgi:hypothetical protein
MDLRRVFIFTASLSLSVAWADAAITFGLGLDFSSSTNPGSSWSYVTNAGSDVVIGIARTDGSLGLTGWSEAASFDGSLSRIDDANQVGWKDGQNGDIVMHSSSTPGTLVGAIWTSDQDGVVNISGAAWDALHEAGRNSNWSLFVNDTLVASSGSVLNLLRDDPAASFDQNVEVGQSLINHTVSIGDTVSFYTQANSATGHFTGVEFNIALTPIPEPQSLSLLVGSFIAVALLLNRRR